MTSKTQGRYVADLRLPGMVEAAFARSPHPHAEIRGVDTAQAERVSGVAGVFTGADMVGVRTFPHYDQPHRRVEYLPLCRKRLRYAGEAYAVVVSDNRYLAEDALERIDADLEPLPAVSTVAAALEPGAPVLHEGWPDNVAFQAVVGDAATARAAFAGCRTIADRVEIQRQAPVPMETRGVVAQWQDGRLTVWTSTQIPQIARSVLAHVTGLPEAAVRVVVPDVGGGFGAKAEVYPEECAVAWLAMRLGRPVRWIEDRYEHMIASCQARDVGIALAAAVGDDGQVRAVRGTIEQNLGAGSMYPNGVAPAFITAAELTGAYRIPHVCLEVRSVVTNLTPSGAYRGFGVPEAAFAMERLMDKIAQETGGDRVELRRRMTITPQELPHTTAAGATIDSGSHLELLEAVTARTKDEHARWSAELAGDPGTRVGWGIASWVQGTVPSFYRTSGRWSAADACHIQFDAGGGITVTAGISAFGQGVTTMLATLVADALRVPAGSVRVVLGDTDRIPDGIGSWGSRSTAVMAGAVELAAQRVVAKGTAIAAHLLEAADRDVELTGGGFAVRGDPEQHVPWERVALAALARTIDLPPGLEPGLDAKAGYQPPVAGSGGTATYTNSVHGAVVGVDVGTGSVRPLCLVLGQDSGRVINRDIVVGQLYGGAAQGVGAALLERASYGEDGTPLSTTLMDYQLPTAPGMPEMIVELRESPAPGIPRGVKGVGEAGIVGPPAAIAAAVDHALAEFGTVHLTRTPILASDVLRAIGSGPSAGAGLVGTDAAAPVAGGIAVGVSGNAGGNGSGSSSR